MKSAPATSPSATAQRSAVDVAPGELRVYEESLVVSGPGPSRQELLVVHRIVNRRFAGTV